MRHFVSALLSLVAAAGCSEDAPNEAGSTGSPSEAFTAGAFEVIMPARILHVSPTGSNANAGDEAHPLRTIQEAANRATPGTQATVHAGTYVETIVSSRHG